MTTSERIAYQEWLTETALDLLDFCENDLSVSKAEEFYKVRGYTLTETEVKNKIFIIAYNLIRK